LDCVDSGQEKKCSLATRAAWSLIDNYNEAINSLRMPGKRKIGNITRLCRKR